MDLTLTELKDAKQPTGQRQQNGINECPEGVASKGPSKGPKEGLNEG
jgi:hypothetical protein